MKKILMLGAVGLVAGCAAGFSPQSQESAINMVELAPDGTVYRVDERGPNTVGCQDYWEHFTLWDRPEFFPAGMTYQDAVAVCRSREQMETEPGTTVTPHVSDTLVRDEANYSVGTLDVHAR